MVTVLGLPRSAALRYLERNISCFLAMVSGPFRFCLSSVPAKAGGSFVIEANFVARLSRDSIKLIAQDRDERRAQRIVGKMLVDDLQHGGHCRFGLVADLAHGALQLTVDA